MPVSTLACPPTQAFLDKYGSENPLGQVDFNRTQGPGVSVPMSLNFKTKVSKGGDSISRKEIGNHSKSPHRASSNSRHRSVPKTIDNPELFVKRGQPQYVPR